MKYIYLSILLLISSQIFGQGLKVLNERYGFRDAKFEMSIESFPNFIKLYDDKYADAYINSNENLKIGDYTVKGIFYMFYKGKLSQIIIFTEGYTNTLGLLSILQQAYGSGYNSDKYFIYWSSKKVQLVYKRNSITDDGTIVMWSKILRKIEEKEKSISNKNTSNEI